MKKRQAVKIYSKIIKSLSIPKNYKKKTLQNALNKMRQVLKIKVEEE